VSTKRKIKKQSRYERQRMHREAGAQQRAAAAAQEAATEAAQNRAAETVELLERRWGSRTGALDKLGEVSAALARLRREESRLRSQRDELVDALRATGESWNLLAARTGLSRQALLLRQGNVGGRG
jgi:hypothetical protein